MGNKGIYGNRQWFWGTGQTALGTADALHPIGVLDEDDTIIINAIPTFTEGVTFTLGDGEVITINATDASGGAVAPLVYTSNMPIAGSTGGRALFQTLPTAQLGGWANAIKGYLDFAVTAQAGGLAGLGSAVCAELRMPNGAVTGHLFPLEVEWVGQANTAFSTVGTGAASGFLWLKANGTVTDFDSDGVFMTVQGLTANTGKLLSANKQTLRCDVDYGTLRYLVLSQAEDCLSLDSCATAIILGDNVTTSGIQIGNVPIGLHLDGDFTDAIKIAGSNTITDGIDIGICATNAINIAAQTGAGITMATAGTYGINLSGDCTTGINIAAQGTMGIALAVAAGVGGVSIDAGTTNHAADGNIVDVNLDVEGAYSVNAFNVNLDFDSTGMGAADVTTAFKADINELVAHTDGAGLYGTHVILTGFATGECDLIGHLVTLDGTKTTDETVTGFKTVCTATIDYSGAALYGNWIDFSGMTHTDGAIYGQYIDLSYANTAADCWGTFYLLSNYGTAISIDAGTTAIDTAADLIYVDLGVNSCSVNVMNVHIDVDTALSSAENVRGLSIDINGNAGDAGDSTMSAIYLTSANTTTGVNTAVEIVGTFDTGIAFSGATFVPDANRASIALEVGSRSTELTVDLDNAASQNFDPIQMNVNLTAGSGAPTSASTVNLIYQQLTHDTLDMPFARLKGCDWTITTDKECQDAYVVQTELIVSGTKTSSGELMAMSALTTLGTGARTADRVCAFQAMLSGSGTAGTVVGDAIVAYLVNGGTVITTDDICKVYNQSAATAVDGIEIENDGAMTVAIRVNNDGTLVTGMTFEGALTQGIDFADVTFTPNSTRTNFAVGIGDRNDELAVDLAASNSQNFDPVQMNLNFTAAGGQPTSSSTVNGIYMQLTHDTVDMDYLRLKGCDWTITTDKACQDAYVVQTELIVSGTKTSSGELMAVSALTTLGTGARTADRVCALQAMLSGSGTAGTVVGDVFAAYIVNAGTVITTDAIAKVFNQSAATSVDGLNVENDGTVTSGIHVDNDGTMTNAIKVDGAINYFVDFDDASTCTVAITSVAATVSAQILVKTAAGNTGYINVYGTTGS